MLLDPTGVMPRANAYEPKSVRTKMIRGEYPPHPRARLWCRPGGAGVLVLGRKKGQTTMVEKSGQLLLPFGPSVAAAEALAASWAASFARSRRAFRRAVRAAKAQKGGTI
jgi:hypothetical protein